MTTIQPIPAFQHSPLLRAAHEFAYEAHHGGRRRGDTDIEHPVAVALLLRDADYPDEVVAAGLLHDVLEDTDTSSDELRERFGGEITDLVGAVTESSLMEEYERRKAALRGQAVEAGADSAVIFAADKLAQARKLNRTGQRPDRPRLSHYRETLVLLRARHPGLPLLDELEVELDRLGA